MNEANPRERSQPTRLVLVSQPTTGGVGVCVRDQVVHARASGLDVVLIAPPNSAGPLADLGGRRIDLELRRQPGFGDIRNVIELRRLLRGVDVVHLHSSKAGAVGRIAAMTLRRAERPFVVLTPHAWSWLVGRRMSIVYKFVEWLLAPTADVVIAVSEAEAEEGRKVLEGRANIVVIPNGVDLARFRPAQATEPRSTPLVVCVGRLAHQKGQDLAIHAIALTTQKSAVLRIVGSGETKDDLRALANNLGVADRIEWVEETDDIVPHLQDADIVLVPSRWDGMSLVLLEALAVGAAVVASDVSGVEAGSGAVAVVPPDDPNAIAQQIDLLLDSPSRRNALRIKARHAAESYDLASTLSSTQAVWEGRSSRARTNL